MSDIKKVLVINGSPKKQGSSTMKATYAFLEGLKMISECEIEIVNVSDLNIKPCLGCLSCWGHTPGECVIKDDDALIMKHKIEDADIVIESYPLYFFGMPGIMKVFTDRMMPMMMTYRGQTPPHNGESFHGIRNPKEGQKLVIISSCAYTDATHVYDSLIKEYDFICGKDNYTMILLPQLKTLIDLKNENKISRHLKMVKHAGELFMTNGSLTKEEIMSLRKPPFTEGAYKIFLDNFWTEEKNK